MFFVVVFAFLFFFVVHWYRYNSATQHFIVKNVNLRFSLWGDSSVVTLNQNPLKVSDHTLFLYNLDDWCYNIGFSWTTTTYCFSNNGFYDFSFVQFSRFVYLGRSIVREYCDQLLPLEHSSHCVWNKCFSESIKNVFSYNNLNFVHVGDDLSVCNMSFSQCHHISRFTGNIVCWNKHWLVTHSLDWYFLMELK